MSLTIVGIYRLQYQDQITSLKDMKYLRSLDFYHDSQQFITEYFATLGQENRLNQKSYDYFAYAALFLPHYSQKLLEKYDDYIYQISPYAQLEEKITQILPPAVDNWGKFRKSLMLYVFRNTLNYKNLFIEKPELEFSYVHGEEINPTCKQVIQHIFYTCFNRTIDQEVILSFVIYLQNLLYSHYTYKLGLVLINGEDVFKQYLQKRLNSEYRNSELRIQSAQTTSEICEICKNNDTSIILVPPFSLVTIKEKFTELTATPHIVLIPITFMNLSLAFKEIQVASQKLKNLIFHEKLEDQCREFIDKHPEIGK